MEVFFAHYLLQSDKEPACIKLDSMEGYWSFLLGAWCP